MLLSRYWLVLASAAVCISSTAVAFPLGFHYSPEETENRELLIGPVKAPTSFATMRTDEDHSYFRPSGSDVSGVPKNTAPYHRSPCPCMNTMANHGYIPRDGKNLTPALLKHVVVEVFHLSDGVADAIVANLPPHFTLADLGVHNFIEHDASMVHDDAYFGGDPSHMNATLVEQFLARASGDHLTVRDVGRWRHDREQQCVKTNPEYDFGFKRQAGAYAEAASFLIAMGDWATQSISVAHARSFLLLERLPDDFERPKVEVTGPRALYVAAKIKAVASFPWEVLAASTRWVESVASREWTAMYPLSLVA